MRKRRNFKRGLAVFFIMITAGFLFGHFALAQVDPFGGAAQQSALGDALGLGAQDPRVTAAKIIRVILGFLGILAVSLVLYGGFLWMTSEGNEQKIAEAKSVLKNAAIGLAIILASFGIATFIINALLGASGGGGLGGGTPGGGRGGGLTALGNGIVESHYPTRNATEIARNTKIAVTFKEAIRVSDIIADTNGTTILGDCTDPADPTTCDRINAANIWISQMSGGAPGPQITDVRAMVASGSKTFVFKPIAPLGSASEKIWHKVGLGRNILKASGRAAFGSLGAGNGYEWMFEVSTFIDNTPPTIESVIPRNSATEPRNVVIQVNFSEAVDPISASGVVPGFTNLVVNAGGSPVNGTFYISNQYRTVEFITDVECGVNSCGERVYCLPANSVITPMVRAGSVVPPFPYDGVVDMADNSLDGDANGTADGSPADDYPNAANPWQFNTDDRIELNAPEIVSVTPGPLDAGVLPNAPVEATFNRRLMSSSINNENIALINSSAYWPSKTLDGMTAIINHNSFLEDSPATSFSPQFKSGIKDAYQNCYKPCGGPRPASAGGSCAVDRNVNPSCCNGIEIPNAGWTTATCP